MKIAAFSDTHGCLMSGCQLENGRWVTLPEIKDEVDVICIAGDIIPLDYQRNMPQSESWFTSDFFAWVREVKAKKVILVGGNHDFFFEYLGIQDYEKYKEGEDNRSSKYGIERVNAMIDKHGLTDKLVYLWDNSCEVDGIKFFGSPWIKDLKNWAFYSPDLSETFKCVEDCDVLITHIPPKIDMVGCSNPGMWNQKDFGSEALREVFDVKNIKVNICGHIHTGIHNGLPYGDMKIYNVSMLNEGYYEAYPVTYFEI